MPEVRASTYRAMVLRARGAPLAVEERPVPEPHGHQVVLRMAACAVCRTDLHVVDGELDRGRLPIVLGHQVVGRVVSAGAESILQVGERVGVPWLGSACGSCEMCATDRENLCASASFTGCDVDGGFAELTLADSRFCLRLPGGYSDVQSAPLLCAGLIGFRALRMAGHASAACWFVSSRFLPVTGITRLIAFCPFRTWRPSAVQPGNVLIGPGWMPRISHWMRASIAFPSE